MATSRRRSTPARRGAPTVAVEAPTASACSSSSPAPPNGWWLVRSDGSSPARRPRGRAPWTQAVCGGPSYR